MKSTLLILIIGLSFTCFSQSYHFKHKFGSVSIIVDSVNSKKAIICYNDDDSTYIQFEGEYHIHEIGFSLRNLSSKNIQCDLKTLSFAKLKSDNHRETVCHAFAYDQIVHNGNKVTDHTFFNSYHFYKMMDIINNGTLTKNLLADCSR